MPCSQHYKLCFSALALLLLAGCQVNPLNYSADPKESFRPDEPEFAYETHVVAKGDALADLDQTCLDHIDTVILGQENLPHIADDHRHKSVLYFNAWGKSRYLDIGEWPKWQIAPGELGEPDVNLNDGVHCYRFDDAHVERFLGWIESFLAENADEVKGVFLDDFSYSRHWWEGSDEDRDLVWGPWDGRPGWREDPQGWNVTRIEAIEAGALALVREYCGESGTLIVNGTARSLPTVRRFAENVGQYNSEAWDRLEDIGVDSNRFARPGDLLQVNGVGATGIWGDWSDTTAGNGWDNLLRASNLAVARDLSVGLAFGVTPEWGGTIYQLYWDPSAENMTWPNYLP